MQLLFLLTLFHFSVAICPPLARSEDANRLQRRMFGCFGSSIKRYSYAPKDFIKKGIYGAVYRATNTETGQLVALKESMGYYGKLASYNEIKVLDALSGQANIIQKYDSFSYNWKVYIALEFAEGGDLKNFRGLITEATRKRIAKEIGQGLKQMHDAGWAHYDIHMSNVLIMPSWDEVADFPSDKPMVKLTDLGISKKFSNSGQEEKYIKKDLDSFRNNVLYELFVHKGAEFDNHFDRFKTYTSIDDLLEDEFFRTI